MHKTTIIWFSFCIALSLVSFSCTVTKIIKYNVPSVNDHRIFDSSRVDNDASKYQPIWKNQREILIDNKSLSSINERNSTSSFLIYKNDTLLFEEYYNGVDKTQKVTSFSMAKPLITLLVYAAMQDGYLKSLDQKMRDFDLNELDDSILAVPLSDLLNMKFGIKSKDFKFLNFFGTHSRIYYSDNIRKELKNLKAGHNKKFIYKSSDTQLVGLALTNALGSYTISDYLESRIWKKVSMTSGATWSRDKKNLERAFCCFNSLAIDYLKIAMMVRNEGYLNDEQLIDLSSFYENLESIPLQDDWLGLGFYNNFWVSQNKGVLISIGHFGQFMYINRKNGLIILRFGKSMGKMTYSKWINLFFLLDEQLENGEN